MIIEITDSNFQQILKESTGPLVIDFWAPWCGPCKAVSSQIDTLAGQYEGKITVGKCDVEENDDAASSFGIRSIPTILFFKDGRQVDKQVGALDRETLQSKFESLL